MARSRAEEGNGSTAADVSVTDSPEPFEENLDTPDRQKDAVRATYANPVSDTRSDKEKASPQQKFLDILYILDISKAGAVSPEWTYDQVKAVIDR